MPRFACVVLVDPRGWVLLQERDEHPAIDPEKWSFSGGHVDDDEQVEAAAYRELAEETGIELPPGALTLAAQVEIFHEAYDSTDPVTLYAAGVDLGDDDIDCREGRQIVFVEPAAALRLDLSATARRVLPDFLDSDLYRGLRTTADPTPDPTSDREQPS